MAYEKNLNEHTWSRIKFCERPKILCSESICRQRASFGMSDRNLLSWFIIEFLCFFLARFLSRLTFEKLSICSRENNVARAIMWTSSTYELIDFVISFIFRALEKSIIHKLIISCWCFPFATFYAPSLLSTRISGDWKRLKSVMFDVRMRESQSLFVVARLEASIIEWTY